MRIVIITLISLVVVSCISRNSGVAAINSDSRITLNSDSSIIFSTKDIDNAKWYSPDEYPLKAIGHDGKIYNNVDYLIKLPNYKDFEIVIWSTEGGDNIPYALCVVKSGIIYVGASLSITPYWSEPGNDENNYCKKTFNIYKGYTIEINTEDCKDGKIQKDRKYFKINDEGDFYEAKK